jgi:hypothetical protein
MYLFCLVGFVGHTENSKRKFGGTVAAISNARATMTKQQMSEWKKASIEQAKLRVLEESAAYLAAVIRAAGEVH